MAKTLGQIRQEVAEHLGYVNSDGSPNFNSTVSPTLSRVNQFVNDALLELTSDFNYSFLQTATSYPFLHTIDNVQGVFLSGTSLVGGVAISGTVVPYPTDSLNVGYSVVDASVSNYSGISFVGTNAGVSYSGISNTGTQIFTSVLGIGNNYELTADVDSIYAVTLPTKGSKLQFINQYDLDRMLPKGNYSIASTPQGYTTFPGLSVSGNSVIQFYPSPDLSYSGDHFSVHYKKKQLPLVDDSDVQTVIPIQFQDIIIHAVLVKCYTLLSDGPKVTFHEAMKKQRQMEMRKFAETYLDYINTFRDGNYLGSSIPFAGTADMVIGSMIWGN